VKQQRSLELVDGLARLAGNAEAPALDHVAARRMIDAATVAASPRRAVTAPRRAFGWPLAAAAFACLAIYAWFAHRAPAPRPVAATEPELLRLTLPTGDRLVGTAGARFEIVELTPAARRLKLATGSMVFDVAHVAPDQTFEVVTDQATVVATGTVFSVAVDRGTTTVHVFEGSVAILHGVQRDTLAADATWSSAAATTAPNTITAAGEDFAREREQRVEKPTPPVESKPTPAPEPVPATEPAPRVTTVATPARREPKPSAVEPAPAPEPPPSEPEPIMWPASLPAARAHIAAGRYTEALAAADSPLREGESGSWDLVRGDALRALGKPAEAASAYEAAARALAAPARLEAAYSAAYLRFHDLKAAKDALADLSGTDEPGSLFEERALVLRAEVLVSLERKHEAQVIAARYLDRFPKGSSAKLMSKLLPEPVKAP